MHRRSTARNLAVVLILGSSACQLERDTVEPGYYGSMEAGTGAAAPVLRPTDPPNPARQSGGPEPAAGSGGPPSLPSAGAPAPVSSAAGSPGSGTTTPMATPPAANATECNLSGRWLSTFHAVTDALGELQYGHYFNYFEIEQSGDTFTVKKGLLCGFDSIGLGVFAATADFRSAWASTIGRVSYAGRTGSSVKVDTGCKVDFAKWYTVRGATVDYYRDPSVPMPSVEQKASGNTPGWEDWDGDGNPGITGNISGIVTGKIFVAPRMWTSISASVRDVSAVFKIPVQWNQEQNVMAYDGTPLLGSEAVRAADPNLHFAQFARLAPDQATGDDGAICKAIVELAPKLTPEAAGN